MIGDLGTVQEDSPSPEVCPPMTTTVATMAMVTMGAEQGVVRWWTWSVGVRQSSVGDMMMVTQ